MAGMGPPPKPPGTRARRNSGPQITMLSPTGRRGKKPPAWPLRPDPALVLKKAMADLGIERLRGQINDCTDRRKLGRLERELDQLLAETTVSEQQIADQAEMEAELWAELWVTPQAAMWERLGWSREVAQYARWKVRAELGDLDAAKEARQWSDRLGLNPLALLRLRWEIEPRKPRASRGGTRQPETQGAVQPTPGADPRSVLRVV